MRNESGLSWPRRLLAPVVIAMVSVGNVVFSPVRFRRQTDSQKFLDGEDLGR